jgi:ABC-type transporter Mla MlaB component
MARRTKVRSDTASTTTPAPLVLPAELTIYTVAELQPLWLSWLSQVPPSPGPEMGVEVQAAAVDQIDAAGMQLLLSLQHALAALGRRCWLRDTSSVLQAGCAALGLSGWLAAHTASEAAA